MRTNEPKRRTKNRPCSRQCMRSGALKQLQFFVKVCFRLARSSVVKLFIIGITFLIFLTVVYYSVIVIMLKLYQLIQFHSRSNVLQRTSIWYNMKSNPWLISKNLRFSKYILRKIHFSELVSFNSISSKAFVRRRYTVALIERLLTVCFCFSD